MGSVDIVLPSRETYPDSQTYIWRCKDRIYLLYLQIFLKKNRHSYVIFKLFALFFLYFQFVFYFCKWTQAIASVEVPVRLLWVKQFLANCLPTKLSTEGICSKRNFVQYFCFHFLQNLCKTDIWFYWYNPRKLCLLYVNCDHILNQITFYT